MQVQVCYCAQSGYRLLDLELPDGATLAEAVQASGILALYPELSIGTWTYGVFGKLKPLDAPLHHLDRVEIYRPLSADPMEARRRRAAKQLAART